MQNTTEKSSRSAEGLYKFFIYFVLVLLAVTIIVPVAWVFKMCIRDRLITAGILSCITLIGFFFLQLDFARYNIIMLYMLGVLFTALCTSGYTCGCLLYTSPCAGRRPGQRPDAASPARGEPVLRAQPHQHRRCIDNYLSLIHI